MSNPLKQLSRNRVFRGWLTKYQHHSTATQTDMKFNIYLPDSASNSQKVPALYWLSGLTCTEDNFAQKATISFQSAAKHDLAIVIPDTSPRGHEKIEGEDKDWDFGLGAGFYVNATTDGYKKHYNMYDYVSKELPELVSTHLPVDGSRKSIAGHSMGGHGALMVFLRNAGQYKSVSAVAPIANPIECPWGQKAFSGYLGADNKEAWAAYDSTMLVKAYNGPKADILIDVGTADNFYEKKQLLPENFKAAAGGNHQYIDLKVRMQPDHDHSFFTISTFITDHIEHHAKYLRAQSSSST